MAFNIEDVVEKHFRTCSECRKLRRTLKEVRWHLRAENRRKLKRVVERAEKLKIYARRVLAKAGLKETEYQGLPSLTRAAIKLLEGQAPSLVTFRRSYYANVGLPRVKNKDARRAFREGLRKA